MKNRTSLWLEFLVLFVTLPLLVCLPIGLWIKVGLIAIGFGFVIKTLRVQQYKFRHIGNNGIPSGMKIRMFIILGLLIPASIVFVNANDPQVLFQVVRNKPLVWVLIFFVYGFLSVIPQEIIYRSFFFSRYESLFENNTVLILVNAFVFSLCHLFFLNTLVMVITFVGGIIFAYTYSKTKSLLLVSLEHTLYGYWIFTVGMGDMLGFPS